MKSSCALTMLSLLVSQGSAHMAMTYPPPLRSKENPFSTSANIDYSITSPLSASGSDFPCKGTLNLLGTAAAQSVATWQAGQQYNMTIAGGANHNGGSCQAALSYDKGQTFTVIHSYIGNCPPAGTSSFKFTVPADAPAASDALFAWTWFNNVGNREFYMNCAVVTVNGGSSGASSSTTASFSSRPKIFEANIGNGCSTAEGSDVAFPNPGPDVDNTSSKTAPPSGNCAVAAGGGSGGGSSAAPANPVASSAPVASNPVAAPSSPAAAQPSVVAPVSSAIQSVPQFSLAPTTTGAAAGSPVATSLPGGVFIPVSSSSVSCDPEVETKTTLATISRPAQTNAAPTASDIVPVPTPTPLPSGGANAPGSMTAGLACTDEGQWLCIEGTHFQRCASGRWSVIMSMAAGTKCQSGTTEFVTWAKKRNHKRAHARRFRSGHI